MARLFAVLLLVGFAAALSQLDAPAITQQLVDSINNDPTSTWKAGWNEKFARANLKDAKDLCGVLPTPADFHHSELMHQAVAEAIPDTFDARTNWPACADIIGHIRDQSVCGSCWAFGAVEAFEDRLCIEGRFHGLISPYDLLSCCSSCGMGCNGGYPSSAWSYLKSTGCVSGGDYKDTKTCAPYVFAPCDHHINGTYGPCGNTQPTPKCVRNCQDGYSNTWDQDKHHAISSYSIASSVSALQTEIMTYGPIEVAFTVYNDFLTYKSGVYQHKSGSQLGGHAVKMLGWGVENGTPYWLVANSWNEGWGDEGYFKILRGSNHCGIESGAVAGRV